MSDDIEGVRGELDAELEKLRTALQMLMEARNTIAASQGVIAAKLENSNKQSAQVGVAQIGNAQSLVNDAILAVQGGMESVEEYRDGL